MASYQEITYNVCVMFRVMLKSIDLFDTWTIVNLFHEILDI